MSVKPILFSTEMVQAILKRRKLVTRRVLKPQPEHVRVCMGLSENKKAFEFACDGPTIFCKAPFLPGDILWVRETFCSWYLPNGEFTYRYKATEPNGNKAPTGPDYEDELEARPWRPSIHMPRKAARIFLHVTNVWAERLQDIDEVEARREGFKRGYFDEDINIAIPARDNFRYFWDEHTPKNALWNYGWDANPWVAANEFEILPGPPAGFRGADGAGSYADSPVLAPA